jgi:hypothetical protein
MDFLCVSGLSSVCIAFPITAMSAITRDSHYLRFLRVQGFAVIRADR